MKPSHFICAGKVKAKDEPDFIRQFVALTEDLKASDIKTYHAKLAALMLKQMGTPGRATASFISALYGDSSSIDHAKSLKNYARANGLDAAGLQRRLGQLIAEEATTVH